MASTASFGKRNYGIQAGIVNGPVNTTVHLPRGELLDPEGQDPSKH
jgi:hypothetical protein